MAEFNQIWLAVYYQKLSIKAPPKARKNEGKPLDNQCLRRENTDKCATVILFSLVLIVGRRPLDKPGANRTIVDTSKKTALVIEGGALRGAYVVGVLRRLHEYGGADQFDAIYAVSSGVFAATYFMAGQVEYMEDTWRDLVHGKQLIDYWNILKGRSALKLDELIDLFKGPVPLDLEKVVNATPSLTYVATQYETGLPHYFDAKRDNIFELMRASSALPGAYIKPVYISGQRYFDGGSSDPIPIKKAITDGCDQAVVILTRPIGYRKTPPHPALAMLCLRRSPKARHALLNVYKRYNESLEFLENPAHNMNMILVRPKQLEITRLTRDREIIIRTIEQGKKDAEEIFSQLTSAKQSINGGISGG